MLRYTDITGAVIDKVQTAIDRLRSFEPEDGYYVAFSGGKDSQCIYHLCQRAGVKFDAHYHVTSVDPPELVRFIKECYPDVEIEFPRDDNGNVITMWSLIPQKKIPPTHIARYCCKSLKESGGKGRVTVTGVRWVESQRRKKNQGMVTVIGKSGKTAVMEHSPDFIQTVQGGVVLNYDDAATRRVVEQCFRTSKVVVNPIVDWEDDDVWEYLNDVERVPHCELYDRGFNRLGCIGCPMSTHASEELDAYPKYKANYLRAFGRMIEERKAAGLANESWSCAQDVMEWWLGKRKRAPQIEGQIDLWED